ncbi:RpoE-regulated lipoprotein [Serratia rubidaea]|nr:RpoE-regulated lipoprotein [Serratia rubidaea]
MNIRPLLLGLPLLLTGCSTMSNFSWSSLSPFNWFGSSLEVSGKGVGGINGGTPMLEHAIDEGLDGNYRLRSGMGTNNGQIVAFYQAMDGDDIKLVISGEPKGSVQRVDVMDQDVVTAWGSKLGTPFSELYSKAFGACKPARAKTSARWSASPARAATSPICSAASGPGRKILCRRMIRCRAGRSAKLSGMPNRSKYSAAE